MLETGQFLTRHSLPLVFGVVFVEQLGLPLPSLPWLLAAGALSAAGKFNFLLGLGTTLVACLAADAIWFYLGKYRGSQMLGMISRISLKLHSCLRRTQNLFAKYTLIGVLISKFLPGMSTVAPPLAGMCGLSAARFFLADGAGSMLYAGCSLGVGYLFSHQIRQIWQGITKIGGGAFILLIGVAVLYAAYKYCLRRRGKNWLA
jgi:membrane protein DedA with SNARE-associated domain